LRPFANRRRFRAGDYDQRAARGDIVEGAPFTLHSPLKSARGLAVEQSMKRIVICMDGTWQTLSQDKLTNIGVLARSIAHTHTIDDGAGGVRQISQIVIYTSGVGSNVGALTKRGFLSGLSASLNRMAGGRRFGRRGRRHLCPARLQL
jgi:uncharacterized protein (DUF2235 family)